MTLVPASKVRARAPILTSGCDVTLVDIICAVHTLPSFQAGARVATARVCTTLVGLANVRRTSSEANNVGLNTAEPNMHCNILGPLGVFYNSFINGFSL
ncbi:hypothetical protein DPMN_098473 [Dreissena polymorpha]|uniref:Uncharacterized protein n=1 Tax=Dreissena polymorpha TaxID=45954 RepID=A0A9D4R6C8_DREPO|nr:hypothetical protein DPMN_098473 [Dreissena polymorpha]